MEPSHLYSIQHGPFTVDPTLPIPSLVVPNPNHPIFIYIKISLRQKEIKPREGTTPIFMLFKMANLWLIQIKLLALIQMSMDLAVLVLSTIVCIKILTIVICSPLFQRLVDCTTITLIKSKIKGNLGITSGKGSRSHPIHRPTHPKSIQGDQVLKIIQVK